MPTNYYDLTQPRTPRFAEDAGVDWQALRQQQEQSQAKQESQIQRAGDLAAQSWNRLGEDARELMEVPQKGVQAYQQMEDRAQKSRIMDEESAVRHQQIRNMERANKLGEKYDETKEQQGLRLGSAQIGQTEANTELSQMNVKSERMKLNQEEALHEPGSAMKLYGNDPMMRQYITDPQMSVADLRNKAAGKMEFSQLRQLDQQFEQAQNEFPQRLEMLRNQVAALRASTNQSAYTHNRQVMMDTVSDLASQLETKSTSAKIAAENRLKDIKGMTPEKLREQVNQAGEDATNAMINSISDPNVKAHVQSELSTRAATRTLQAALAKPTLDPMGAARDQLQTQEYTNTFNQAKAIEKLMALRNTYINAAGNGVIFDTADAAQAKDNMVKIAKELGDDRMAEIMAQPWANWKKAQGAIEQFIGSLAGQVKYSADKNPNHPATAELRATVDDAMKKLGILSRNDRGYALPDALEVVASKGKTQTTPLQTPTGPAMPAFQPRNTIPGRRQ